jgi:hypothetical protein
MQRFYAAHLSLAIGKISEASKLIEEEARHQPPDDEYNRNYVTKMLGLGDKSIDVPPL